MNEGQIGCCAYVSLGFGTPQMQYFLASLRHHYKPRKPILVCEPHSEAIPDRHRDLEGFSFHRVVSPNWKAPYWYLDRGAGENEYREALARWISTHRPEMLVVTSVNQFQPLLESGHLPSHIIYYAFEAYEKREMTPRSIHCHDTFKDRLSLVLFPEAERLRLYNREFGYRRIPKALIYNVPPLGCSDVCKPTERNGRILMQGTIQWGLTYPEYLLNTQKPDIPIDVFGPLYGNEAQILRLDEVSRLFGFRYFGYVANGELARLRCNYSYVLVMWNPVTFNSRYACPNKFFEAIASGVPPICAPHPQCAEILRKYDCGILMRDWSFDSFCQALEEARRLRGTSRYRELVRNCIRAHRRELNWEAQFRSISALMPGMSGQTHGRRRFILVAPELVDESGKSFRHGLQVLKAARRFGLQPVALVNRILRCRLPGYITTHPVFWHDMLGRNTTYPNLPIEADAPSRFVMCLRDSLEREQLHSKDHVYVPSLSSDFLAAFARWLAAEGRSKTACWHITLVDGEKREHLISTVRLLGSAISRKSLRIYSESTELAEEIEQATGLAVRRLPLPVLPTSCSRRRKSPRSAIFISYLGNATHSRGFAQTSAAVERAMAQVNGTEVRFAVKCHSPVPDSDFAEEVRRLQKLSAESGRLDLIPRPLANTVYSKLLSHSDIILNSYDPTAYRRKSSSVFVEALCADKVVLVPRGSWMASQLPAGCPWVYSRPEDIPSTIREVVSAFPRNLDLAKKLGAEWRKRHTGENLMRTLLS